MAVDLRSYADHFELGLSSNPQTAWGGPVTNLHSRRPFKEFDPVNQRASALVVFKRPNWIRPSTCFTKQIALYYISRFSSKIPTFVAPTVT